MQMQPIAERTIATNQNMRLEHVWINIEVLSNYLSHPILTQDINISSKEKDIKRTENVATMVSRMDTSSTVAIISSFG